MHLLVLFQHNTTITNNYFDSHLNSEQQLVDCAINAGDGCYGGWPASAWDYIKSAGGSHSTASYSYKALVRIYIHPFYPSR